MFSMSLLEGSDSVSLTFLISWRPYLIFDMSKLALLVCGTLHKEPYIYVSINTFFSRLSKYILLERDEFINS